MEIITEFINKCPGIDYLSSNNPIVYLDHWHNKCEGRPHVLLYDMSKYTEEASLIYECHVTTFAHNNKTDQYEAVDIIAYVDITEDGDEIFDAKTGNIGDIVVLPSIGRSPDSIGYTQCNREWGTCQKCGEWNDDECEYDDWCLQCMGPITGKNIHLLFNEEIHWADIVNDIFSVKCVTRHLDRNTDAKLIAEIPSNNVE